jgi:hypothetical protein
MKKAANRKGPRTPRTAVAPDEILPEYDFSGARRRNPYAARFRAGVTVVLLDPDVARAFPDATAVNDALRQLTKVARRKPRKTAKRSAARSA